MKLLKKKALKALVVGSGLMMVSALPTSALAAASFASSAEFEIAFFDIPLDVSIVGSLDSNSFATTANVTNTSAEVFVDAFGSPAPGSSANDQASASVSFVIENNSSVLANLRYALGYSVFAEVSQGGVPHPDDSAFANGVIALVLPDGNANSDVEADLLSGPQTESFSFPPAGSPNFRSFDLAAGETALFELSASASGRAVSGISQASVPAPSVLALLTLGLGILTLRLRNPG